MAVQHNQVVGDTAETGPAPQSIDVEKDDVYHQEAKLEMLDPRGQAVDYSGATKKTDPAEIKLVRKLDLWIMPTLWLMYWLNYLDRNAITLARLNDFEEDLGLEGAQYQTAVSILFVGYTIGQIPSNMIITRVRPSLFMAGFMVAWAIISALTAVVHDYTGIVLVRFFLGIVEAPYYPGALYMLSTFYTRKELATRISILYSGNILASAFAGLIAVGVFEMDNMAGIAGWRWLFIIQGAVTLLIAFVACFTLPDEPLTTRWLTPEERQLAHDRVARDTVGLDTGKPSIWSGFGEAMQDPKVWVFIFLQHMHLATNGFKNFFPTIVETLGFNRTITLVLTCPPYLVAGGISILWARSSGHFNESTWHITVAKIVAIFGFVLGCATLNVGARYFAMCVFTIGTYAVNSIILAWCGNTCGQTKEKKASALAIVNVSATISFIWTPYLWPSGNAPRYEIPLGSSAGFAVACVIGVWGLRWMLIKANRKIRTTDSEAVLFYAY